MEVTMETVTTTTVNVKDVSKINKITIKMNE
jgi:hypothetical protein